MNGNRKRQRPVPPDTGGTGRFFACFVAARTAAQKSFGGSAARRILSIRSSRPLPRGAAGKLGLPVGPGAVKGAHAAVFYEQKALREPFGETAIMCDDEQRPLPAGQEPFERLQRI